MNDDRFATAYGRGLARHRHSRAEPVHPGGWMCCQSQDRSVETIHFPAVRSTAAPTRLFLSESRGIESP